MVLDLIGRPVEAYAAPGGGHEAVEIELSAPAMPFGLSGSDDKIAGEGVFGGFIDVAPVGDEGFPLFLGCVRKDESTGAGVVFDGVFRGGGAAFGRSGAGAATIAFFGFEIFGVEHLLLSPVWGWAFTVSENLRGSY